MDESILGVTLGQCAPTGLVWVLLNRYLVTIDFVQTGAPLLYVAPPQLNTIGGPTRVIGNTTVYNGKRVFATALCSFLRHQGSWLTVYRAWQNSLPSEPRQYGHRNSFAVELWSSSAIELPHWSPNIDRNQTLQISTLGFDVLRV